MQALFDLHEDIIEMYAYHAEMSGAWSEPLKVDTERAMD